MANHTILDFLVADRETPPSLEVLIESEGIQLEKNAKLHNDIVGQLELFQKPVEHCFIFLTVKHGIVSALRLVCFRVPIGRNQRLGRFVIVAASTLSVRLVASWCLGVRRARWASLGRC